MYLIRDMQNLYKTLLRQILDLNKWRSIFMFTGWKMEYC